jgi:hypothetical protein
MATMTAFAPARTDAQPVVLLTDARHEALEDAARRWITDGDTPEVVASYAHALRTLIGDI